MRHESGRVRITQGLDGSKRGPVSEGNSEAAVHFMLGGGRVEKEEKQGRGEVRGRESKRKRRQV